MDSNSARIIRYELLGRLPANGPSFEQIKTLLLPRGFVLEIEQPGRLELVRGGLRICVDEPSEKERSAQDANAQPSAPAQVRFSFPLGSSDEEGEQAIATILELAALWVEELFDPQLGSLVTGSDAQHIGRSWREHHRFHFEVVGSNGLGASAPSPPKTAPRSLSKTRTKVFLGLMLFSLLLVLVFHSCLDRWMQQLKKQVSDRAAVPDAHAVEEQPGRLPSERPLP